MGVGSVLGSSASVGAPRVGGIAGGAVGAALGGAVGAAVGAATKKKKKRAAGGDAAAAIDDAAAQVASAATGPISASDAMNLARSAVSAAPQDVRQALRDVARELQASKAAREQTVRAIETSPQVKEIVGAVRLAQLQARATSEHRGIVAADERHRLMTDRQIAILAKLDEVLAKLNGVTPVPNRFASVLGGRGMLGRLVGR